MEKICVKLSLCSSCSSTGLAGHDSLTYTFIPRSADMLAFRTVSILAARVPLLLDMREALVSGGALLSEECRTKRAEAALPCTGPSKHLNSKLKSRTVVIRRYPLHQQTKASTIALQGEVLARATAQTIERSILSVASLLTRSKLVWTAVMDRVRYQTIHPEDHMQIRSWRLSIRVPGAAGDHVGNLEATFHFDRALGCTQHQIARQTRTHQTPHLPTPLYSRRTTTARVLTSVFSGAQSRALLAVVVILWQRSRPLKLSQSRARHCGRSHA